MNGSAHVVNSTVRIPCILQSNIGFMHFFELHSKPCCKLRISNPLIKFKVARKLCGRFEIFSAVLRGNRDLKMQGRQRGDDG